MCHFVTAIMSPDGDVQKVARCAQEQRLHWVEIDNPSIVRQLHAGERYFYTTRNMCDCSTAIGSALRKETARAAPFAEREVEKLRKQGWSVHKIERWQEERRRSFQKEKTAIAARNAIDRSAEVQNWLDFFHLAAQQRAAPMLGLLLHWYHGGLHTENIVLAARVPWNVKTIEPQQLLEVAEDTLYVVRLW